MTIAVSLDESGKWKVECEQLIWGHKGPSATEALEAVRRMMAEIEPRKSPADMAARVETLERQVKTLLDRGAAFEMLKRSI